MQKLNRSLSACALIGAMLAGIPSLARGEGSIISSVGGLASTEKPFTSAMGFPLTYPSPQDPPKAIDNVGGAADLITYTWNGNGPTTNSIGFSFDGPELINRIRLWKDDNSGTGAINYDGMTGTVKDWTLYYTTSSVGTALNLRTWIPVTGLTNGFNGTELLHLFPGGTVNSNGTIVGDIHDSVNEGDGYASLSFNTVMATGLRIEYANNPIITTSTANFFKLHDARAFYDELILAPEPGSIVMFGVVCVFGAGFYWLRRRPIAAR